MEEIRTQEEFEKDINYFVDNLFDDEDILEWWLNAIHEYYIGDEIDYFHADITFYIKWNPDIAPVTKRFPIYKPFEFLIGYGREYPYWYSHEYITNKHRIMYLTYELEEIKKLFNFKDIKILDKEPSCRLIYLLANPRKEVVKWALEHKGEFRFNKDDYKKALSYQAIPELKGLIEKELYQSNY